MQLSIASLAMLLALGAAACSRKDNGDAAAHQAGRAAYKVAEKSREAAEKAAKKLKEAGREAREGWNEAKHEAREADKKPPQKK